LSRKGQSIIARQFIAGLPVFFLPEKHLMFSFPYCIIPNIISIFSGNHTGKWETDRFPVRKYLLYCTNFTNTASHPILTAIFTAKKGVES